MSKYAIGEHIDLNWGDGDAQYDVIKGHVPPDDALAALRKAGWNGTAPLGGTVRAPEHGWARWTQTGHSRLYGWSAEMRLADGPGRGCFAVTVIHYDPPSNKVEPSNEGGN